MFLSRGCVKLDNFIVLVITRDLKHGREFSFTTNAEMFVSKKASAEGYIVPCGFAAGDYITGVPAKPLS